MTGKNSGEQSGFSATAIVAVILAITVLGLVVRAVHSSYHKPSTTTSASKTTDNNQISGNTTAQQQTDPNAGKVLVASDNRSLSEASQWLREG
jgi:septal ring-binding cell division protein DamX